MQVQPTTQTVAVLRGTRIRLSFQLYRGDGYVDLTTLVDVRFTVKRNYVGETILSKSILAGGVVVSNAAIGEVSVDFFATDLPDCFPNTTQYYIYTLDVDLGSGDQFVSHRGPFLSQPSAFSS